MQLSSIFGLVLPILIAGAAINGRAPNEINKEAIDIPFDESVMVPIMEKNMPVRWSRYEVWEPGWIPEHCKNFAKRKGLNPWDIQVFNAFYDDCSEPWIMCRHKNADYTIQQIIDMFGRLPVRMRGYVAQLEAYPWLDDGALADTDSFNIAVRGKYLTLAVLAHEISHNLDRHALKQYFYHGEDRFSATGIWRDNVLADVNVVTPYAATSWIENFGATGVIGCFDTWVPGGIGTVQPHWDRVFHAYRTYTAFLGNTIQHGGRCEVRLGNSPVVPMGNEEARAGGAPDFSITSVPIIEQTGRYNETVQLRKPFGVQ